MIQIKRFVTNPIGENCYLVWDDTLACAVIDCGAWGEDKEAKIARFIEENHLSPCLSLQTHMHFDHIFGLHFLHRSYGLRPLCHAGERQIYDAAAGMARDWFGFQIPEPPVPVERFLAHEEEVRFGNTFLRVIHTPGHTPGSVMFYQPDDKVLFSGDTLFQGSVGRTDTPGGDMEQEITALRERVLTLSDDVVVYPGHGPSTTIGDERLHNPYL